MKKMKLLLALGIIAAVTIATLGACASSEQKPTVPVIQNDLKSLKVGDITTFGTYPKYEEDEKEPIEWRVLAVEDGKVLIITEKAIDCKRYNEEWAAVTWETCTLRAWLNDEFFNMAFNQSEKEIIMETKIENQDNPVYDAQGGEITMDKVFLLSLEEAIKYFNLKKNSGEDKEWVYAFGDACCCQPTEYAISQGAEVFNIYQSTYFRNTLWWLRSPGSNNNFAAYVFSDGYVLCNGYGVNNEGRSVRPALWIEP